MSKLHIITRPTRVNDLSFEEYYNLDERTQDIKATQQEVKKWRLFKQNLKSYPY